jgi:hypothetical protein
MEENENSIFMKTKEIIIAVVFVIFTTALCVTCNLACRNSSSSSAQSFSAQQELYNADIDELDNLVSEIVRWENQYMETKDESVAKQGEKLCGRLRELSLSLENKVQEGKLSIEQQERINEILQRLPQ